MTGPDDRAALARLVREEGGRVLAALIRMVGDWQLAEDAVGDAVVRALETWPRTGVPAEPRAWLILTARRRALDLLRREGARAGKEGGAMGPGLPAEEPPDTPGLDDDLLRLVFTCCHPALDAPTRVALALRTLCGLSTVEVARVLLVGEATMTKRLTRAKQKIARAGIPYRVPEAHELPARMGSVAATVYFLFTQGYARTAPGDSDPAGEAVRLARLLHGLLPGEATTSGLLALLLLQHSRRDARLDADGRPVLLADQDRARWHHDEISEAVVLLGEGLRRSAGRPDAYVVQAAVAACHALAPTAADTDWDAVVSWYDVLLTVRDGPVERLNRAVAVGERDGPGAGLDGVDAVGGLGRYAPWHASRAILLARLGRDGEARQAFDEALEHESDDVVAAELIRRRASLAPGTGAPPP